MSKEIANNKIQTNSLDNNKIQAKKPEVGFDLSKVSLSDLFGQEEDFDVLEDDWEDYQEELEAVNSEE